MIKRGLICGLVLSLSIILIILLIRFINPREIDDVSPGIPCSQEYMKKSSVLWIIPKFNNTPISENKTWCEEILSLNKTLGLHGVTHEYEEFKEDKTKEYLEEGIRIFEDCFGFKPTSFKPPQLKISENNKELIKENNLDLKLKPNQISRKVYHCNDTGDFPNKLIDWI